MQWLIYLAAGYLAGSLPTGVLIGRRVGLDPRTRGSGNIGASNVTRTLGRKWGAITLLIDVAKGALPTAIALWLAGIDLAAWTAFAAVVGHCFPIWLAFKGGKGVATAFGGLLVLAPVIALVGAMTWIALVVITRTPAIGSLVAAAMFPILTRVDGRPFDVHLMTVALFGVIAIRHASNLKVLARRYRKRR